MSDKTRDVCPSMEAQEQKVYEIFKTIVSLCKSSSNDEQNFHKFEEGLKLQIQHLACALVQLFLISAHLNFKMSAWRKSVNIINA